ncbi:MAG TPA: glycoside hydrolase family 27 protein [Opitutaceae bacterium]
MHVSQRLLIRIGHLLGAFAACAVSNVDAVFADVAGPAPEGAILTPPAPASPRINGPRVIGVRPGSPLLYTIPATGVRPMTFSADDLPGDLRLDPSSGMITGTFGKAGDHVVVLHASNANGTTRQAIRIRVGEQIALTPPMGWNSWNCWSGEVDQDKVLRAARAMVASGLSQHGWVYVNIDDTWQGLRGGPFNGIQPDLEKFPDIKGLCDAVHGLGLKIGIYSTPWTVSYAKHIGGTSENAEGKWDPLEVATKLEAQGANRDLLPWAVGKYSFAKQDAKQWAAWGIDYLKYDWFPMRLPETRDMANALRTCGRDIVFSITNGSSIRTPGDPEGLSNICMREHAAGDIRDSWESVESNGLIQDAWSSLARPGHWNDPDMLVLGVVGWGNDLHPSRLTPNEQYSHISLWCLLSAPLLLGCDLERLDPFTLGLLTNDEVLAVDQDPLGRQGVRVWDSDDRVILAKPMEDGSWAVGIFNRGTQQATLKLKWTYMGIRGRYAVRDLWRQKDLGTFNEEFSAEVPPHGVLLARVTTPAN